VDDEVAVVGQYPLGPVVALDAQRSLAALLELELDLVANGLNLPEVGPGTDHEVIGEGTDPAKVENADVERLLRLGRVGRGERRDGWRFLGQRTPLGETARDLLERTAFGRMAALGPNGAQRVARLRELTDRPLAVGFGLAAAAAAVALMLHHGSAFTDTLLAVGFGGILLAAVLGHDRLQFVDDFLRAARRATKENGMKAKEMNGTGKGSDGTQESEREALRDEVKPVAETPLKAAAYAALNFCDMIDGLSEIDAVKAVEVLKQRIMISMIARQHRAADDQDAPDKRYCLFDRKNKKYAAMAEITNDDGTVWSILWNDDIEDGSKFSVPDSIIVESYLMLFARRFGEKQPQHRFDSVEVAAYAATLTPTMTWKCLDCGNKWQDLRECGPVVQAGCPACGSKNILDCNVDTEVQHG